MNRQEPSIAVQAFRGSFHSVGASLITLGLGFARSILLARLLMPEHFGLVALALFYIGLAAQLRGLGFDAALIHRQEVDEPFLRTYFTCRAGLDLLAFGALLGLTPLLQRAYPHMESLGVVFPALLAAALLSNLSQIQETLLRKHLAFGRLATTDIVASAVMTLVAPLLAWRGWGVWALVAEQLSGLGARFILTWGPFRQWRPRFGWDRDVWRRLWEFGKPTWVAGNLSYLLDRFDDFWVGAALGGAALGYYSRSYEFAHYPRRVFANPLVSVFATVYARLQHDRLRLSQAFYRSAYFIIRTGFLIAGLFALVMPEFIRFVIGEKWLPMLWTFRLMLVYTALDALLMLVDNLMLAVGKPHSLRQARIAQAVFFVPAVIVGAHVWQINGVAVAADLMLLIGAWQLYRPLRATVEFSLPRLLLWPAIALALAWGAGYWIETQLSCSWAGVLALKSAAFVALFGGLLLAVERDDYVRGLQWLREVRRT